MSAAVEAAIESIPSVGFSLLDYSIEADFEPAKKYTRIIVEQILSAEQDKHMILNVNIPAATIEEIKGIKEVWNVPLAGMFSNAEIGRTKNGNVEMHNLTTCWVALKEK